MAHRNSWFTCRFFGDFPYVSLPECMWEWFWYLLVLFVSSTKNQEVQLENRSASMSDCARVTFFLSTLIPKILKWLNDVFYEYILYHISLVSNVLKWKVYKVHLAQPLRSIHWIKHDQTGRVYQKPCNFQIEDFRYSVVYWVGYYVPIISNYIFINIYHYLSPYLCSELTISYYIYIFLFRYIYIHTRVSFSSFFVILFIHIYTRYLYVPYIGRWPVEVSWVDGSSDLIDAWRMNSSVSGVTRSSLHGWLKLCKIPRHGWFSWKIPTR